MERCALRLSLLAVLSACGLPDGAPPLTDPADAWPQVHPSTAPLAEPRLAVAPDPLDFGALAADCAHEATLTLANLGGAPLTVNGLEQSGDGAFVVDAAPPWTLSAEQSLPLTVSIFPSAGQEHLAVLTVHSDANDVRVTLSATGVEPGAEETVTERWVQPEAGLVDLYLWFDTSASTDDEQDRLQDALPALLDGLDAAGSEARLWVGIDDAGCAAAGPLTSDDPDEQRLTEASSALSAAGGVWAEAGLMHAALSASAENRAGCNAGLVRDGARLDWLLVSDEPDASPATLPWSTQLDRMRQASPAAAVSALVGLPPEGCAEANPGDGYLEAADATGGVLIDWCDDDWAAGLAEVAALSATYRAADAFILSRSASRDTLVVTVDGALVGWTLEDATHLRLDAAPAPGAVVEASYPSSVACP
ncbi:MAG: hypothetical protein H6739_13850 [Alphaproteobacteria bacterium]|nr:hypothetical protein [Alphaproteobacteria bacterium]